MGEKPWIKVFTSDLLASLIDMSADAQHVFLTVLLLLYDRDRAIPHDVEQLVRRTHRSREAVETAISELLRHEHLRDEDGKLTNSRVEKDLAVRDEAMRTASENGKNAANARWRGKKPLLVAANDNTSKRYAADAQRMQNQNQKQNQNENHNQSENQNESQTQNQNYLYSGSDEPKNKEGFLGEKEEGTAAINTTAAGKKKRMPLPEDFELTPELIAIARKSGVCGDRKLRDVFQHFVSHMRANGRTSADWGAAWSAWCCRSRDLVDHKRYAGDLH